MTAPSHRRACATAVAAVALLVSGCGGASAHTAGSTPTRTGAQPVSQSAAADEPVVAVIRRSGALELYGIRDGQVAHRLRVLRGPAGTTATAVTLSGGAQPTVCVLWHSTASPLECYGWGSDAGTVVAGADTLGYPDIALSASGRSLAWTGDAQPNGPELVYARLNGTAAGPPTRLAALSPGQEPDEAALMVSNIAWDGDDALLVSSAYDDDVNGAVSRVSLAAPPKGWSNAREWIAGDQAWPVLYGGSSAAVGGRFLATQLGFDTDGRDVTRAVELEVATGHLLDVVSTPATGRRISSVSGGAKGVLYRTEDHDGRDLRTYWRPPGQAHGRLLVGLPADAVDVVAQP